MNRILTIGHSTHDLETFVSLLKSSGATAVADVRSIPVSRFTPQFNREPLRRALETVQVKYVFMGKELGARPDDPSCYINGRVQYERLAKTGAFQNGVERLRKGMTLECIALMCAEHEPLDCHRTILVSRALSAEGIEVAHIHRDGRLEEHAHAMRRLVVKWGLDQPELLRSGEDQLNEALYRQEQQIAFVDTELAQQGRIET